MWKPVLTLLLVAGMIFGAINYSRHDPLGSAITKHLKRTKQVTKKASGSGGKRLVIEIKTEGNAKARRSKP